MTILANKNVLKTFCNSSYRSGKVFRKRIYDIFNSYSMHCQVKRKPSSLHHGDSKEKENQFRKTKRFLLS